LTANSAETTVDEMRTVWLTALLAVAVACSSGPNIQVQGCADCKPGDGGKTDAGEKTPDAGPPDAGPRDAGAPDSGPDAGGSADAGLDAGFDAGLPLTGTVCPAQIDGGPVIVMFSGQVTDLCADQALHALVPLPGVQVATLAPFSATLTDANGNYSICVPQSSLLPDGGFANDYAFTLVFTLPTYVTTYEGEFTEIPGYPPLPPLVGAMELACESALHDYAAEDPTFNLDAAAVFSPMISASNLPPCEPDAGFIGWSFLATLPDGGAGPGGPWPTAYFDDSGDLQVVGSTFDIGRAFMYNIDPSAGYVSVHASNPDIPNGCNQIDQVVGFTGRIFVSSGAVSFYPWVMP
jgi:hypothetical protein